MTSPCTCRQHDDPRTGRLERLELCAQHQQGEPPPLTETARTHVTALLDTAAVAAQDFVNAHIETGPLTQAELDRLWGDEPWRRKL